MAAVKMSATVTSKHRWRYNGYFMATKGTIISALFVHDHHKKSRSHFFACYLLLWWRIFRNCQKAEQKTKCCLSQKFYPTIFSSIHRFESKVYTQSVTFQSCVKFHLNSILSSSFHFCQTVIHTVCSIKSSSHFCQLLCLTLYYLLTLPQTKHT